MKKLTIISLLVAAMFASCNPAEVPESPYSLVTNNKYTQGVVDNTPGYFGHIKNVEEFNLLSGVTLYNMEYVNANGYAVRMMLYKVTLGGSATLAVTTPEDQNSLGALATLSEQAAALDARESDYVLGAINGDGFSTTTNHPNGILYRDGVGVKTTFANAKGGFFATLKDGSAGIYTQEDYSSIKNSIVDALGTTSLILSEGYALPQTDIEAAARTAVGVSADGTNVYLVVVDGVYFFYSNGITCADLAAVMKACGASDAALLDSGECTTLVRRNNDTLEVYNSPHKNNIEKPIANGLAIVAR